VCAGLFEDAERWCVAGDIISKNTFSPDFSSVLPMCEFLKIDLSLFFLLI